MNVSEIIKEYLKKNGYDGLCNDDNECECEPDDLAPCGWLEDKCKPGKRVYSDGQARKNWNIR